MWNDTADYFCRRNARDVRAGKTFLDTLSNICEIRESENRYMGTNKKKKGGQEENARDERAKFPERNYPWKTQGDTVEKNYLARI